MLLSIGMQAQSFRSGYFLDNYTYGYRINPAQVNDRSFFGLGLSNIDLQNYTSFGVSDFLFPNAAGNGLVTGLNKSISSDTFLKGLRDNNYLCLDENINLLSLGISNGRQMHTFEINARAMATLNVPKTLFSLVKKGSGNYDINGFMFDLSAMTDISYGFSTKLYVIDNLSVGGRLHLLLGLVNSNLQTTPGNIKFDNTGIAIEEGIEYNGSGLLSFDFKDGLPDLSTIGFKGSPFGGIGVTVDLGAEYKADFGLDAMVSVTDLGAISWENGLFASASAKLAYNGGNIGFEGGTIKADILDMFNDLSSMFELKSGHGTRSMQMMPFNIQAGARYYMPFYSGLSVGVFGTYHVAKLTSWYDLRAGATLTPARILSLTGNVGVNSFGGTWGAALNLHLGPINLLVGADSYMGKSGKVFGVPIPLNGTMENVHFGLCFTFGKPDRND